MSSIFDEMDSVVGTFFDAIDALTDTVSDTD